MTAEIASIDRVRTAVSTLRQRGVNATADRVIALIGGSKSTVLQHMRAIRELEVQDTSVPPSIFEMARQSLVDIFEAGCQAEADRVKVLTERMANLLAEQEAQIQELADENATLAHARAESVKRLEEANAVVGTLTEKIAADERTATEQLRTALANFQAMISEATAVREVRSGRPSPSKD